MDCEHATLLLPWLLNGSLDPDEHRRVVEHLAGCERCRAERAATERAGEVFAQHLPEQTLVDHGFGRAPARLDQATIEEHLAICPRCAAELELVRETAWRARGEGAEVLPFVPRRPPASSPLSPSRRWAALAAGLALVVGLGSWYEVDQIRTAWHEREAALTSDLERATTEKAQLATEGEHARREITELGEKVAALAAPQGKVWMHDVYPTARVERGERLPQDVEIPAGTAWLVLVLQASSVAQAPAYELEIATPGGEEPLHLVTNLVRQSEDDSFIVSIPAAGLPPELTLRLYGRRGEQRREIARYELTLDRANARE